MPLSGSLRTRASPALQGAAEPLDALSRSAHDSDSRHHHRIGSADTRASRNTALAPAHDQRAVVATETEVVDHDDVGSARARAAPHVVQPRAPLSHRVHSKTVRDDTVTGEQERCDQLQDPAGAQRVAEERLGGADGRGAAEDPVERSGFGRVVGFRPGPVRIDVVDVGSGQTAILERRHHRPFASDPFGVRRGRMPRVAGESVAQDLGQRRPASGHLQIPALEHDDSRAFTQIEARGVGERGGLARGDDPQRVESRHDRERHRVGTAGDDEIQLAPSDEIGADAHGGIGAGTSRRDRHHPTPSTTHALDDGSAVRDQRRRDVPGTDSLPLVAQDVPRDLLGAREAAMGAAEAHADPFRIELPEVHSRVPYRLAICLDGQKRGSVHPRSRIRIHFDRNVVAEAAGQIADEAACVEVGHLGNGVTAIEQGLSHFGAVAPQWRESSHSDNDRLTVRAGTRAPAVRPIAGREFAPARRGATASLVRIRSRCSVPVRSRSGIGREDTAVNPGDTALEDFVQRRNPPSTRRTVPLQ